MESLKIAMIARWNHAKRAFLRRQNKIIVKIVRFLMNRHHENVMILARMNYEEKTVKKRVKLPIMEDHDE